MYQLMPNVLYSQIEIVTVYLTLLPKIHQNHAVAAREISKVLKALSVNQPSVTFIKSRVANLQSIRWSISQLRFRRAKLSHSISWAWIHLWSSETVKSSSSLRMRIQSPNPVPSSLTSVGRKNGHLFTTKLAWNGPLIVIHTTTRLKPNWRWLPLTSQSTRRLRRTWTRKSCKLI